MNPDYDPRVNPVAAVVFFLLNNILPIALISVGGVFGLIARLRR